MEGISVNKQTAESGGGNFPSVQGRCPSCGATSLFLGAGGYVTCSRATCSAPDAASTLLEARLKSITCGARYGQNPEVCYHEASHVGPHSNRYGTTWGDS